MKILQILARLALASAVAASTAAVAHPVVYTLRTVADGKLGNHVFAEALVTLRMRADTASVVKQPSLSGGTLYKNGTGTATVTVTDASGTIVATFAQGEVYVMYDTGTGIAGFGSAISPTYPVALDCDDYAYPSDSTYKQDCLAPDWHDNHPYYNGTLAALADPSGNSGPGGNTFSDATMTLPQTLTRSTLLTGRAHSCATAYTVGADFAFGDLQACSGPAPRGLRTDHGGFFLQDQIGGSNDMNVIYYNGWELANTGSLQVEVLSDD